MEQDAAPADLPRKQGLGRPGVIVRGHYGASAFNGWTGKGERWRKPPGWTQRRGESRRRNVALARKHDPPDRKAAMERRKACAVRVLASPPACGTRPNTNVAPRGAPFPSWVGEETKSSTRAAARERNDVAV